MKRQPGTTLIELVIALAVSGICMAAISAGTASVLRTRGSAAEVMTDAVHAAHGRALIIDLLSGAFADDRAPTFQVRDGLQDSLPDHSIVFLTRHTPGRTTAVARVAIYLDRDSSTIERGLVVAISHGTARPRRIELAPGATTLTIRYRSNGTWQTYWHTPFRTPDAVMLEVGPAEAVPRLLGLPIPVQLGAS